MSQLQLSLLGTPGVKHGEHTLTFSTRKALALLVYLAVEGSGSRPTTPDCERASSGVSLLMTLPEYVELRDLTMYQAEGSTEPKSGIIGDDDQFATQPVPTVETADEQWSEEELHTLFEQALSDRMQANSACLRPISGQLTHRPNTTHHWWDVSSVAVEPSTEQSRQCSAAGTWSSLLTTTWQRGITLACLALMLVMTGFDLMGLLILHMR
jgi:hypothetical protein